MVRVVLGCWVCFCFVCLTVDVGVWWWVFVLFGFGDVVIVGFDFCGLYL